MVNLEWFRTFKYIYENNSLTVASQKLFMTQPGVSKQLNALEAHVGKKLFDRTSRKMLPTEYGKFLYTQVVGHLEGLERAEMNFKKECNKNCPSLVIGCTSDTFRHSLFKEIQKVNMYLTFQFGDEDDLSEQLEREKIHLLIADQKPSSYDYEYKLLFKEELSLIASPSLTSPPFAGIDKNNRKEISQWMATQTWYAYNNQLKYINDYWKANFGAHPNIMVKYVIPSGKDIASAIEAGNGLSVLPAYLCKNEIEKGNLKSLFPEAVKPEIDGYWIFKKSTQFLYEINLLQNSLKPTFL